MYFWVIPVTLLATNARSKTRQFSETIARGGRYLQPSSRALAVGLASLTYLISQHPNPATAARWKVWAAAMAILATTGPYEIYAVFPINDKIEEIGSKLEKKREDNMDAKGEEELDGLLRKWRQRHVGRIVMPMSAALLTLWDVISAQAL